MTFIVTSIFIAHNMIKVKVTELRSVFGQPLLKIDYTVCPLSLGRRNEAVNRGVLGLLRSPKASLGPQGRAQITFRYRRHIYGLNGESR